ncbi:MurR/RpiR family transcriptional regulator [Acidihalobacter ferrooxydans]|uniref:RpiR family transcriptional regulator n=1 Tax=Acidihalobacter ferrooxydans TaxID=1765967 RepID=A0A1P8UKW2_9GAMM|nr:MurR/RpiR family transcriptional regulator [Acidihalobacter ferrooxydans]APZ44404.1 RpiR family transcriptional regulator [Acidihalobacter ferrooxydans]
MDESIAQRVTAKISAMPASERKVAQTLIANFPLAGLKTVAEFSRDAGVSAPTVLRFLTRIGFQNYGAFQAALKEELGARLQSPLARSERLGQPINGQTTSTFVRAVEENIAETLAHLGQAEIEATAALLGDKKRTVYLVGGRFTDPVARYAAAHLRIIRPRVVHLDGQESSWHDRLLDMTRADVLVLFDIRRYQPSLLRFAEAAVDRRVVVVLFTDQWLSPLSKLARHVFAAHTSVPSPWDSSAALFVLVELLLARITEKSAPASVQRIRKMERLKPHESSAAAGGKPSSG